MREKRNSGDNQDKERARGRHEKREGGEHEADAQIERVAHVAERAVGRESAGLHLAVEYHAVAQPGRSPDTENGADGGDESAAHDDDGRGDGEAEQAGAADSSASHSSSEMRLPMPQN
jgi:hypothetical protein